LLRFLEKGLINVDGKDERLGYLTVAANDLSAAVAKAPAKTVPFALAAFDPRISAADPVVVEAAEALKSRWKTYSNAFKEAPVGVIRAIVGAGLYKTALDNDAVAVGVTAIARNVIPHIELGNEGDVWRGLIGDIEAKVDERAEREWSMPDNIEIPSFTKPNMPEFALQATSKKVDRETLAERLQAAAGPQARIDGQGDVPTSGNPHWPQANQAWVGEFGPRMAMAIAQAIDASTGALSVKAPDLSGAVDAIAAAATEHLAAAMQAVSAAAMGLQRRTNLLWWKEALYSPSAHDSYRRMPGITAAALMAFDLHDQVPTFSPASVSAFLQETVKSLPDTGDGTKIPLRDLVDHARQADLLEPLRRGASVIVEPSEARGPLLALIGHVPAAQPIDDVQFRDLTGLPPETALTLPGWAAWLFGEFQALRATAKSAPPKRRNAKKV